MATNIQEDMEEFAKNISLSSKKKKIIFEYGGKLGHDSTKNYPILALDLHTNEYKVQQLVFYFYSNSEGAIDEETVDLKNGVEDDLRKIKYKFSGKSTFNDSDIFIIRVAFEDSSTGDQNICFFYTYNSNNINQGDAENLIDSRKSKFATKYMVFSILLDINIFSSSSTGTGSGGGTTKDKLKGVAKNVASTAGTALKGALKGIGNIASFLGKNSFKAFKNMWENTFHTRKYRYRWVLFNNEEDYLYCELLHRHPHDQPQHKRPMKTSVTAHHPESGTHEFKFSEMFSGRITALEVPKLIRRGEDINDNPRFSDLKDIHEELKSGKILGLGVANAIEGDTFWSIVLRPFGLKGNKLNFDPNELYWKWNKYTYEDLYENNITFKGKVIEVDESESSEKECEDAEGIKLPNVFIYEAEKTGSGEVKILKEIKSKTMANKEGEFTITIKKEKVSGKDLIFIASKRGYKKTNNSKFNIINRPSNKHGVHLDLTCGSPDDLIHVEKSTKEVNNIRIPMLGTSSKAKKAPYILLFDENKKKVLDKKGIVKSIKRKKAVFIVESEKKTKSIPDKLKLGLFCFDETNNLINKKIDGEDLKWELLHNDKPFSSPRKFDINSFNGTQYKYTSIIRYSIESTDIIKILSKNAYLNAKKYTLIGLLTNEDKYDETEFSNELKLINSNPKDFIKKYKDNADRSIYDFQILKIDANSMKFVNKDFKDYLKELIKVIKDIIDNKKGTSSLTLGSVSNRYVLKEIIGIMRDTRFNLDKDIFERYNPNWNRTDLGKPIKEIIDEIRNNVGKSKSGLVSELEDLDLNNGKFLTSDLSSEAEVKLSSVRGVTLTTFKPIHFFRFIKFVLKKESMW